jgi:hypothetical protein
MLSQTEIAVSAEPIVQRDMDLIRQLLLDIEGEDAFDGTPHPYQIPTQIAAQGHSARVVGYHLQILFDAGLVLGNTPAVGMPVVRRLTWHGHEFIDNIKSDDIWSRTKARVSGLPGAALSVVVAIAESEVKKWLGLTP